MADPKPLHLVLLGQLQRATVTRGDPDSVDSLSVDAALLEAVGFLAFEKVELASATSGVRLALQVVPVEAGSGEIGVNGAASHLVQPSEVLTVSSWGWLKEKAARRMVPRVLELLDGNRIAEPVEKQAPKRKKTVKSKS